MEDKKAEAVQDQLKAMAEAKDSLERFWAGSAGASIAFHVRRGAVRKVKAE